MYVFQCKPESREKITNICVAAGDLDQSCMEGLVKLDAGCMVHCHLILSFYSFVSDLHVHPICIIVVSCLYHIIILV